MEEWGFLDDRELDSFRGHRSCSTCTHFGYVNLGQCQVLGSCHLRQGLLAPAAHPLKSCKQWVFCSAVDPYKEDACMDATQKLVERRVQNTGESQAVATANVLAAFKKLKKIKT